MTKMQIWSKETPRRLLRKKPKKKVSLFEAPRQFLLHPRLFFSFSRTHRPAFLFYFLFLSHLRLYPFLVLTDPALACLPEAFTAIWFEPDLPLHCWDPPDICLACSNFLADAWTSWCPFWALVLSNSAKSSCFSQTFPVYQFWLKTNFLLRFFFEID